MEMCSRVLKLFTIFIGIITIIMGYIIGVLGTGLEGPHNSVLLRALGIYMLVLGGSYIIPDKLKLATTIRYRLFMAFELTPLAILFSAFAYSILAGGIDAALREGVLNVLSKPAWSLVPPLSLLLARKIGNGNPFIIPSDSGSEESSSSVTFDTCQ